MQNSSLAPSLFHDVWSSGRNRQAVARALGSQSSYIWYIYIYIMCIYIYIYIYMYTCIHVYMYMHTYICIYIYTPYTVYIYIYTHTYIHTYMHACMHACMHTYIHTYLHTYMLYFVRVCYDNGIPWRGSIGLSQAPALSALWRRARRSLVAFFVAEDRR